MLSSVSTHPAASTPSLSAFLNEVAVTAHKERSLFFTYVPDTHFAITNLARGWFWVPLVQKKSVSYSLLSKGVTNNKQRGICCVLAANKADGLPELIGFATHISKSAPFLCFHWYVIDYLIIWYIFFWRYPTMWFGNIIYHFNSASTGCWLFPLQKLAKKEMLCL